VKKLFALFFLLVYGFSSMGATVHAHQCMGKFTGISLVKEVKEQCSKCGMKEKEGCCKDVEKRIQIEDDHSLSNNTSIVPPVFLKSLLVSTPNHPFSLFQLSTSSNKVNTYTPILYSGIPIYLLVGVFRI
jgi:hypothetical protein